ncbi:MAG: type transport system permease protein [Patescibacteria group bacterium]|nr:type transport system permease protein [Patescibacteria group bacterium]
MSEFKTLVSNLFSKRNKALLRELVVTDFKLRYQNSALGYAWSLLKPLGMFGVLYVVFTQIFRFGDDIQNFPVYLLLGIVLWTFFIEATGGALQSIVARGDLIRKISFPKYIIVISGTISAFINFLLSLMIVLLFATITGVDFGPQILFMPLLILELYLFSLGVGLMLAALFVNFRDLSHIWEVLMQAAFYAVPIIYPLKLLIDNYSGTLAKIVMLNPISQILQDMRFSMVTDTSLTTFSVVQKPIAYTPYILTFVVLILGGMYFRAKSRYFAEQT